MKKIVIAPDSFKGTMSSMEVCDIVEKGIKAVFPGISTCKIPIADGGEGTVDSFLSAVGGTRITKKVKGPRFAEVEAFYGILPDGKTAVVEMAAASGLPLVGEDKDPTLTTTYGVGQLMLDALDRGCDKLIIGLGGSATNDGGIGMAGALGVKFLDAAGKEIPLTGGGLAGLHDIDASGKDRRLENCTVLAACDVDNPLYGKTGAAHIFGPQKGADEKTVELLDANLRHYAGIVARDMGIRVQDIPGAGAAGGLGAGLVVFAGARLQSGIKIVLDTVHFDQIIEDADLILTGEGKIDGQSLRGKVPVGIAERAAAKKVPVVAVVGDIGDDIAQVYARGIHAVFSINRVAVPFQEARLRCKTDLLQTVESIMRFANIMLK